MRPKLRHVALPAVSILLIIPSAGQASPEHAAQIDQKCQAYFHVPLPEEASTVRAPTSLPSCHSLWRYYGFGGEQQDTEAARKCAWKERALFLKDGQVQGGPGDDGLETLANIYANGVGVPRDVRLALRFACESAKLQTLTTAHIDDLEDLLAEPAPKSKKEYFNMCDGSPVTPEVAICANWQEVLNDDDRGARFAQITSKWTAPQKAAFATLLKAEGAYAAAHGRGEVNMAGTMRAVFEVDAEAAVHNDFAAALESFEAGHLPAAAEPHPEAADAALNQEYRAIMTSAQQHKDEYGAVDPDGIRNTERAWLKYRDAWIAFAALRYPQVDRSVWLDLLTRDRTLVLKATACEVDFEIPGCPDGGDPHVPQPLP